MPEKECMNCKGSGCMNCKQSIYCCDGDERFSRRLYLYYECQDRHAQAFKVTHDMSQNVLHPHEFQFDISKINWIV